MSTHTPGPWTSYPCNLERYSRVITAKGAMVQVAYTGLDHHDQVAMTKSVYGDRMTYGPGEETTANAQLIVAAPDLLAALENLYAAYCGVMSSEFDFSLNPWTPERDGGDSYALAARAAIAKATGGTS